MAELYKKVPKTLRENLEYRQKVLASADNLETQRTLWTGCNVDVPDDVLLALDVQRLQQLWDHESYCGPGGQAREEGHTDVEAGLPSQG